MTRGDQIFLAGAVLSIAVAAGEILRQRPPAPLAASAPPVEFSAVRAREALTQILGDGRPHPTGSAGNGAVRQRLLAKLTALGYTPVVQTVFVTGIDGTSATVNNVIARLPGSASGRSVLLSVHYDSVPAGPGASDDGIGLASALEVARALKSEPPLPRGVIFLFDDGEEAGLLGATAFLDHPWARDVGVDVNLEARGTSGPALMFETSGADEWLIRRFAGSVTRPATGSLFASIYRRMPNDTDLTIFRHHGWPGVNFACIGGVARYHTPRDDLAHVNLSTLQHEGESALQMIRALASGRFGGARSDAVFFDLFSSRTVWWPIGWTAWLTALAVLLLLISIRWSLARRGLRATEFLWGVAGTVTMLAGGAVIGWLALKLARAAGVVRAFPWVAHPAALLAALFFLTCVVVWLVARRFFWSAQPAGLWGGVAAVWGALSILAAVLLPGGSYLFLLPALAAPFSCPIGTGEAFSHPRPRWRALLLPVVSAFFWLPLSLLVYQALGLAAAIVGICVALWAATLAPLFLLSERPLRNSTLILLGSAGVLALGASFFFPPLTIDFPRHGALVWERSNGAGAAWLMEKSGPLPASLAGEAKFSVAPSPLPGGEGLLVFKAPAPGENWSAPLLKTIAVKPTAGGRKLYLHLSSPRAAPVLQIAFPPEKEAQVRRVFFNGVPFPPYSERRRGIGGWEFYSDLTVGRSGLDVVLDLLGRDRFTAYVSDISPQMPPESAGLLAARPPWIVPAHSGDRSILWEKVSL